jgi:hypothetical protein
MVFSLAEATVRAVGKIINGKQQTPQPAYAFTELLSKEKKAR